MYVKWYKPRLSRLFRALRRDSWLISERRFLGRIFSRSCAACFILVGETCLLQPKIRRPTPKLMSGRKLIIRRNLVWSYGDGFIRGLYAGNFTASIFASDQVLLSNAFIFFCWRAFMTFRFSTSCATNALCGALEVGEYANVGYLLLPFAAGRGPSVLTR